MRDPVEKSAASPSSARSLEDMGLADQATSLRSVPEGSRRRALFSTYATSSPRARRESQEYNRGLIESNIDALMTTDPLGIITDVNRQTCEMTGDELIRPAFKLYFIEPQRAEDGIRKVLSDDRVTNHELTMRSHAGKATVASYNATTFRPTDGATQPVAASRLVP